MTRHYPGLVKDPSRESGANLGINKPGSDGDSPPSYEGPIRVASVVHG